MYYDNEAKKRLEEFISKLLKYVPYNELPNTLLLDDVEYALLSRRNATELDGTKLTYCYGSRSFDILSNYQYQIKKEAKRLADKAIKEVIND